MGGNHSDYDDDKSEHQSGAQSKVADGGACMNGWDCASYTCDQTSNKHTGKGECVAGNGGRRSLQSNDDNDDDDEHTRISEIEKLPHLIDGGGLEIDEKSVLELKAGALQLNGRLVSNGDVVIGDEAEIYISKELYHLKRTTTDSNSTTDSVTAKIVLDVYPAPRIDEEAERQRVADGLP